MDLEQLKGFSAHAVEFGMKYLLEHGQLRPMFMVYAPEKIDIIEAQLQTGSIHERDLFIDFVRNKARELGAYGVAHVSDAWIAAIPQDHPEAELARSGRYGTAELEHMGIVKRREVIFVTLETPIYQQVIQQFYRRSRMGNITLEERIECDSTSPGFGGASGRIFGFFPKVEGVHA